MTDFDVVPDHGKFAELEATVARLRKERDAWKRESQQWQKMYADLAKKWNDNVSAPCFMVLPGTRNS